MISKAFQNIVTQMADVFPKEIRYCGFAWLGFGK